MILGVGLDVVPVRRLTRLRAEHGERFTTRVFAAAELQDCLDRADADLALAARVAAKEACLKALGIGLGGAVGWLEVEVVRAEPDGAPAIRLTGRAADRARARGVRAVHVSLTHDEGLAAAVVILEGDGPGAPAAAYGAETIR
jgi:holo-[acyl-carrier protein] synthase